MSTEHKGVIVDSGHHILDFVVIQVKIYQFLNDGTVGIDIQNASSTEASLAHLFAIFPHLTYQRFERWAQVGIGKQLIHLFTRRFCFRIDHHCGDIFWHETHNLGIDVAICVYILKLGPFALAALQRLKDEASADIQTPQDDVVMSVGILLQEPIIRELRCVNHAQSFGCKEHRMLSCAARVGEVENMTFSLFPLRRFGIA